MVRRQQRNGAEEGREVLLGSEPAGGKEHASRPSPRATDARCPLPRREEPVRDDRIVNDGDLLRIHADRVDEVGRYPVGHGDDAVRVPERQPRGQEAGAVGSGRRVRGSHAVLGDDGRDAGADQPGEHDVRDVRRRQGRDHHRRPFAGQVAAEPAAGEQRPLRVQVDDAGPVRNGAAQRSARPYEHDVDVDVVLDQSVRDLEGSTRSAPPPTSSGSSSATRTGIRSDAGLDEDAEAVVDVLANHDRIASRPSRRTRGRPSCRRCRRRRGCRSDTAPSTASGRRTPARPALVAVVVREVERAEAPERRLQHVAVGPANEGPAGAELRRNRDPDVRVVVHPGIGHVDADELAVPEGFERQEDRERRPPQGDARLEHAVGPQRPHEVVEQLDVRGAAHGDGNRGRSSLGRAPFVGVARRRA